MPLFSDWRGQGRLGPSDRGRPLGRDQGRMEKAVHKSNHDIETIPCTPTGAVLRNRLDTNSIVGTDICVYSIVGAVGLLYDEKPPTCLWASIVLWAPGFIIPGTRGRAPHIPKVFCRYQHLPFLKKTTQPPMCT